MKDMLESIAKSPMALTAVVALTSLSLLGCSICGFSLRIDRPRPPERDFQMEDLFIDSTVFPEGWQVDSQGPHEACEASPLGSGCRAYAKEVDYEYKDNRHQAKETIYRYLSKDKAHRDFDKLLEDEFIVWEPQNQWVIPDALNIESSEAGRTYLACHEGFRGAECQLAAQYEEFVVVFSIDRQPLSDEQLMNILQAIDRQMVFYLH